MRVLVIGASNDRAKYGNKAVRAHVRRGHTVLPVNPNEPVIEGLAAYPDVVLAPGPIDRALFYVPPRIGLEVIGPLAGRGDVREVWLNPGAESPALIAEAKRQGFQPILACAIMAIGEYPD
jgi:predicted CoA-binding protein